MAVQLWLMFYFLRQRHKNIPLANYRQFKFSKVSSSHLSFSNKGALVFLGGYFSSYFFAPRASVFKQYKYGFDVNLLPLKTAGTSLMTLKKNLSGVGGGAGVTTSLGAWGSKFKHCSWFRAGFFFKKTKKKVNFFYGCSLGFWRAFIPVNFFLLLQALPQVAFSHLIISPRAPGVFFYNKIGHFLSLREQGGELTEQVSFVLALSFFSNLVITWRSNSIFFLSPDELNYHLPTKNSILASFSEFTVFYRLFNLNLAGVSLEGRGNFFWKLIFYGVWVVMAVPKHKRYRICQGPLNLQFFFLGSQSQPHQLLPSNFIFFLMPALDLGNHSISFSRARNKPSFFLGTRGTFCFENRFLASQPHGWGLGCLESFFLLGGEVLRYSDLKRFYPSHPFFVLVDYFFLNPWVRLFRQYKFFVYTAENKFLSFFFKNISFWFYYHRFFSNLQQNFLPKENVFYPAFNLLLSYIRVVLWLSPSSLWYLTRGQSVEKIRDVKSLVKFFIAFFQSLSDLIFFKSLFFSLDLFFEEKKGCTRLEGNFFSQKIFNKLKKDFMAGVLYGSQPLVFQARRWSLSNRLVGEFLPKTSSRTYGFFFLCGGGQTSLAIDFLSLCR